MFNHEADKRKVLLDKAKQDRLKREQDRLLAKASKERDEAAIRIQRWARSHQAKQKSLEVIRIEWDTITGFEETEKKITLPVLTAHQLLRLTGLFLLFSQRLQKHEDTLRLSHLCKLLLTKAKKNDNANTATVPFHALLADSQYAATTHTYILRICILCIERVTGEQQPSSPKKELYTSGAELRFLLFYLDCKNYNLSISQYIDKQRVDTTPLPIIGMNLILLITTSSKIFEAFGAGIALRVISLTKFQNRIQKSGTNTLSVEDIKYQKSIALWMMAVMRCSLLVVESVHASRKDMVIDDFIVSILANPILITCLEPACLDMLKTITEEAMIRFKDSKDQVLFNRLDGNAAFFLMSNLVDLCRLLPIIYIKEDFVFILNRLIAHIRTFISDEHSSSYHKYHPIFLWYRADTSTHTKETIPTTHYTRAVLQLEYIWSRRFLLHVFSDVIEFTSPLGDNTIPSYSNSHNSPSKKPFMNMVSKLSIADTSSSTVPISSCFVSTPPSLTIYSAATCDLYLSLLSILSASKQEILNNIMFAPALIPQLWRVLLGVGPKGGIELLLDCGRKGQVALEKEISFSILKLFSEGAVGLILTLDDNDLYESQIPFKLTELIDLSSFLNQFYFILLQIIPPPSATSSYAMPALPAYFRPLIPLHKLLLHLHDRDTRRPFCPPNHWLLIKDPKRPLISIFSSKSSQEGEGTPFLTRIRHYDTQALLILHHLPHTIPFETRLSIFRDSIAAERSMIPSGQRGTGIRVRREFLVEDGLRGLSRLGTASWKGNIHVKFVNEIGVEEIGVDMGGPFKEFITQFAALVFSPDFSLFSTTPLQHLLYPSATSNIHGTTHLEIFELVGKVLGKALYEGILVDAQFARFFLAKILGRMVFLEELAGLDEDIWKGLMMIKKFEGDVNDLGLSFEIDEDVFGKTVTKELKKGGKSVSVTNENRIEYIYLLADYKLNGQTREQSRAFIRGFQSIISEDSLRFFSPPELQRLLSGEDIDFDITDLRNHTKYQNGYFDSHPTIRALWKTIEEFEGNDRRAFLKFVTGCSKPPLGGFSYLQPSFTVRLVPLSGNEEIENATGVIKNLFGGLTAGSEAKKGRLPTSSTCFNLLKLPAYPKKNLLKEKLSYAIRSNTGFELS